MVEKEKEVSEFQNKILLELIDMQLTELMKKYFKAGLFIGLIAGSVIGYLSN